MPDPSGMTTTKPASGGESRQREIDAAWEQYRASLLTEWERNARLRREILPASCWWCGRDATTLDHFVPKCRGGELRHGNIVPACRRCNVTRGHMPARAWNEWLATPAGALWLRGRGAFPAALREVSA